MSFKTTQKISTQNFKPSTANQWDFKTNESQKRLSLNDVQVILEEKTTKQSKYSFAQNAITNNNFSTNNAQEIKFSTSRADSFMPKRDSMSMNKNDSSIINPRPQQPYPRTTPINFSSTNSIPFPGSIQHQYTNQQMWRAQQFNKTPLLKSPTNNIKPLINNAVYVQNFTQQPITAKKSQTLQSTSTIYTPMQIRDNQQRMDNNYNLNSSRIKTTTNNVTTIRPQNHYQKVQNGRMFGTGSQVSGMGVTMETVSNGYSNNTKISAHNNNITINTNNILTQETANSLQNPQRTASFKKVVQQSIKQRIPSIQQTNPNLISAISYTSNSSSNNSKQQRQKPHSQYIASISTTMAGEYSYMPLHMKSGQGQIQQQQLLTEDNKGKSNKLYKQSTSNFKSSSPGFAAKDFSLVSANSPIDNNSSIYYNNTNASNITTSPINSADQYHIELKHASVTNFNSSTSPKNHQEVVSQFASKHYIHQKYINYQQQEFRQFKQFYQQKQSREQKQQMYSVLKSLKYIAQGQSSTQKLQNNTTEYERNLVERSKGQDEVKSQEQISLLRQMDMHRGMGRSYATMKDSETKENYNNSGLDIFQQNKNVSNKLIEMSSQQSIQMPLSNKFIPVVEKNDNADGLNNKKKTQSIKFKRSNSKSNKNYDNNNRNTGQYSKPMHLQLQQQNTQLRQKIQELQQQLTQMKSRQKKSVEKQHQLQQQFKSIEFDSTQWRQRYVRIQRCKNELQTKFNSAQILNKHLSNRITQLQRINKEIQFNSRSLSNDLNTKQDYIQRLEKDKIVTAALERKLAFMKDLQIKNCEMKVQLQEMKKEIEGQVAVRESERLRNQQNQAVINSLDLKINHMKREIILLNDDNIRLKQQLQAAHRINNAHSQKISNLDSKQNRTREQISELTIRNGHLESKINQLTNKNRQLSNRNSELVNRNSQLTNTSFSLTTKINELNATITKLNQKITQLQLRQYQHLNKFKEMEQNEAQYDLKLSIIKQGNSSLVNHLQKQIHQFKTQVNQLNTQINQLNTQINQLNTQVNQFKTQINQLNDKNQQINEKYKLLGDRNNLLQQEIANLQIENINITKQLSSASNELKQQHTITIKLNKQLHSLKAINTTLQEQLNQHQQTIKFKQEYIKRKQKQLTATKKQIQQLKKSIQKERKSIQQDKQKQNILVEEKIHSNQQKIQLLTQSLQELREEIEYSRKEVEQLRKDNAFMKAQKKPLNQQLLKVNDLLKDKEYKIQQQFQTILALKEQLYRKNQQQHQHRQQEQTKREVRLKKIKVDEDEIKSKYNQIIEEMKNKIETLESEIQSMREKIKKENDERKMISQKYEEELNKLKQLLQSNNNQLYQTIKQKNQLQQVVKQKKTLIQNHLQMHSATIKQHKSILMQKNNHINTLQQKLANIQKQHQLKLKQFSKKSTKDHLIAENKLRQKMKQEIKTTVQKVKERMREQYRVEMEKIKEEHKLSEERMKKEMIGKMQKEMAEMVNKEKQRGKQQYDKLIIEKTKIEQLDKQNKSLQQEIKRLNQNINIKQQEVINLNQQLDSLHEQLNQQSEQLIKRISQEQSTQTQYQQQLLTEQKHQQQYQSQLRAIQQQQQTYRFIQDRQSALRQREVIIQQRQNLVKQKQEFLKDKQDLIREKALKLDEREIEMRGIYQQINQQFREIKNKINDQKEEQVHEEELQQQQKWQQPQYQQSEQGSQRQQLTGTPTQANLSSNITIPIDNHRLQQQQQKQQINEQQWQQSVQMLEVDKNALIYICQLLAIEPLEGKLLSSIISKLEEEGEQIINTSNMGNSNKDRRVLEKAQLQQQHQQSESRLSPQQLPNCQLKKSLALSQGNQSQQQQPPSQKEKNSYQEQLALKAFSEQEIIENSQILSQRRRSLELQQQYIQILQFFQISAQNENHHQLLFIQLVNIKQTISMLVEEVKSLKSQRQVMEKQMRESKMKAAMQQRVKSKKQRQSLKKETQQLRKQLHLIQQEMIELKQSKQKLQIVYKKLQQENIFITHELITLKFTTSPFFYNNNSMIDEDEQNQQAHYSNGDVHHQRNEKTIQQGQVNNTRENNEQQRDQQQQQQLLLIQIVKSHDNLNIKSGDYFYANLQSKDEQGSPLKLKRSISQGNLDNKNNREQKQNVKANVQQQMISLNSLEEELDMISQINTEQLTLYNKLSRDDRANPMLHGEGDQQQNVKLKESDEYHHQCKQQQQTFFDQL